jgi:hypothetical protein
MALFNAAAVPSPEKYFGRYLNRASVPMELSRQVMTGSVPDMLLSSLVTGATRSGKRE